jgi:hypothetical protein
MNALDRRVMNYNANNENPGASKRSTNYNANNENPGAPKNTGAPPGTPMNTPGRVDVNAETLATLSAAAQLLREHVESPSESAGAAAELEAAADNLDALIVNGSNTVVERAALAAAAPVAKEAEAAIRLWNTLPANAANYGASERRKYEAASELFGVLASKGYTLVKKGVKAAGSVALNTTRRVATVTGKKAVELGTNLLGKGATGVGYVGIGLTNLAIALSAAARQRAAQEYNEFVKGRDLLAREHLGNVPELVRTSQDPRYAAAVEAARIEEARHARLETALNGVAALPPRAPKAQRRAVVNALAALAPVDPLPPATGMLGGPVTGAPAPQVGTVRQRRAPGFEYSQRVNMNARYNREGLLAEARRRGITVIGNERKDTLIDRIIQNMFDNGEVRRPGMGGRRETRRKLNKRNKSIKRR